jgi:ribosomal protein L7/L12
VKELAGDDQKIQAIKLYRDETGAGLKEAKYAVEASMDSLPR